MFQGEHSRYAKRQSKCLTSKIGLPADGGRSGRRLWKVFANCWARRGSVAWNRRLKRWWKTPKYLYGNSCWTPGSSRRPTATVWIPFAGRRGLNGRKTPAKNRLLEFLKYFAIQEKAVGFDIKFFFNNKNEFFFFFLWLSNWFLHEFCLISSWFKRLNPKPTKVPSAGCAALSWRPIDAPAMAQATSWQDSIIKPFGPAATFHHRLRVEPWLNYVMLVRVLTFFCRVWAISYAKLNV